MDGLIDENGITIFSTFEHIFLVLSTIVFGLSVFAITRGSTHEMGVYRWFLLNEVIWSFLFDLIISSFQPVFMFPGPLCVFVSSIFFRRSNNNVTRLLALFFWMTFMGKTHAFASALVHRFVCAFPEYSRVSQVYRFVTPWVHIGILILPFSFILPFVLPYMFRDHSQDRNGAFAAFPVMQEIYERESTVGCALTPDNSKIVGIAVVTPTFFTFLFLIYGYLFLYTRHLLQQQSRLTSSAQTLKLQKILLRACAVQILGNFAFMFIPNTIMITVMLSRPLHSQLYFTTTYLMLSINSIFNYFCLIVFIRPYREITVNKLRRLVIRVLRSDVNHRQSVTMVQSFQTVL